MKILKEGRLPEQQVYQTTCTKCGTEYEFKRGEARFSSDQRDGDALVTKCPLPGCGKENWIRP